MYDPNEPTELYDPSKADEYNAAPEKQQTPSTQPPQQQSTGSTPSTTQQPPVAVIAHQAVKKVTYFLPFVICTKEVDC